MFKYVVLGYLLQPRLKIAGTSALYDASGFLRGCVKLKVKSDVLNLSPSMKWRSTPFFIFCYDKIFNPLGILTCYQNYLWARDFPRTLKLTIATFISTKQNVPRYTS